MSKRLKVNCSPAKPSTAQSTMSLMVRPLLAVLFGNTTKVKRRKRFAGPSRRWMSWQLGEPGLISTAMPTSSLLSRTSFVPRLRLLSDSGLTVTIITMDDGITGGHSLTHRTTGDSIPVLKCLKVLTALAARTRSGTCSTALAMSSTIPPVLRLLYPLKRSSPCSIRSW